MAQAPTLTLDKATTLGINYTVERLGTDFRFSVTQEFTITAIAVDATGTNGEIGNQAKVLDDLVDTQDYCTVTVNGRELAKRAKLIGFTLGGQDRNWTQLSEATFKLSVIQEGNLDDILCLDNAHTDFPGIPGEDWPLTKEDLKYLQDFSESFDFSRGANVIDYSHQVSARFDARIGVAKGGASPHNAAITAGLQLCKSLLDKTVTRPAFAWTDFNGFYTSVGVAHKRLFTESVNDITGEVSVTEKFDAGNLKDGDNYSFEATQSFVLKDDGVINVSENGTVIGLLQQEDKPIRAMPNDAVLTEIANARKPFAEKGRLQLIFNAHKSGNGLECEDDDIPPLKVVEDEDEPDYGYVILIEKGITYDYFRGKINYRITGTNDEKIQDKAVHEYTKSLRAIAYEGGSDTYLEISQNGSFKGIADTKETGKARPQYDKAVLAWDEQREIIKENLRIDIGVENPRKYHVSITNTYSIWKGQIGYDITYSDAPECPNEDEAYKKKTFNREVTLADQTTAQAVLDPKMNQFNVENVLNHPKQTQMIQKRQGIKTPKSTQTFNIVGKRDAKLRVLLEGGEYTNNAGAPAAVEGLLQDTDLGPGNSECSFLSDASYTFNEDNDKILNVNLNWE